MSSKINTYKIQMKMRMIMRNTVVIITITTLMKNAIKTIIIIIMATGVLLIISIWIVTLLITLCIVMIVTIVIMARIIPKRLGSKVCRNSSSLSINM